MRLPMPQVIVCLAAFDFLLAAGILFFGLSTVHSTIIGPEPNHSPAEAVIWGLRGLIGLVITTLSVPALIALTLGGIGLLRRKPWGRRAHLIGAALIALSGFGIVYAIPAIRLACSPAFRVYFPGYRAAGEAPLRRLSPPDRFRRFRLRTLVGIVVIAAILLGGIVLTRRYYGLMRHYAAKAEAAWADESTWSERARLAEALVRNCKARIAYRKQLVLRLDDVRDKQFFSSLIKEDEPLIDDYARRKSHAAGMARYYAGLVQQYRRAAHYPWLAIPSDPPPPE